MSDLCWECREKFKDADIRTDLLQFLHCHHEPKEKLCEHFNRIQSKYGDDLAECIDCHAKLPRTRLSEKPKCWCEKDLHLWQTSKDQIPHLGDYLFLKATYCPECGRKL